MIFYANFHSSFGDLVCSPSANVLVLQRREITRIFPAFCLTNEFMTISQLLANVVERNNFFSIRRTWGENLNFKFHNCYWLSFCCYSSSMNILIAWRGWKWQEHEFLQQQNSHIITTIIEKEIYWLFLCCSRLPFLANNNIFPFYGTFNSLIPTIWIRWHRRSDVDKFVFMHVTFTRKCTISPPCGANWRHRNIHKKKMRNV